MPFALPFPPISPELFSLTLGGFTFALRWYALAYIAGLLAGWWIMLALVRRPALWPVRAPIPPEAVEPLISWAVLGIVAGGRLGYCLFYRPGHYLANPWEIPMVWQGGMAFHGGLAGCVLVGWAFARRHGGLYRSFADMAAAAVPVGLLLGRLANFVNAELWGRPTDLPWGVVFPGAAAQDCGQPAGVPCARHPSQLYEAGLEGLLLGLVILVLIRGGALMRPGLVAGVFVAGYGLARFAVEFVRQPDAQFATAANPVGWALDLGGWGLTMGQILSVPMILAGAWLIASARRPAPAPA